MKCRCGAKMKPAGLGGYDIWGNRVWRCSCGLGAKQVPIGSPDSILHLIGIFLQMIGIHRTVWLEKEEC